MESHSELTSGFFICFPLMVTRADLDIKPINKRASGQAFEVILKPSSPVSDTAHCITSPPKRDISLEDIQKKLEAAEDRRRVRMFPIIITAPSCHVSLDKKKSSNEAAKAKPFLTNNKRRENSTTPSLHNITGRPDFP